MAEPSATEPRRGWLARLKQGLARSSARLVDSISAVIGRGRLDAETLEALEEALIAADLGPRVAIRLVDRVRQSRFERGVSADAIRTVLADEITQVLKPVAKPFAIDPGRKPQVILVAGVNGSGKTTTIAKLANHLKASGQRSMLAACDTFRAAAVTQLQIWGERIGAPVIAAPQGADAAALAYEAFKRARTEGVDALFIDTAGRLHNKADLMAELGKIDRVLKKLDPEAPHDCILVLDATTGQNAIQQVEIFKSMVPVSGLVVTKLDGSARGGVLVALAERFAVPVIAIGVGEGIDDLDSFAADAFAADLLAIG